MEAQNTRSQMNRSRTTLEKHCKTCAECHKPVDKTQTRLESCQHHSPSSNKVTASANPEKATHSPGFNSSSKIPIRVNKKEQVAKIPSNQVDSLAVSVPNNSEDKPDIVIVDSSSDEEEPAENYCANLQQKKPTKKSTMYPIYKDFSDQEQVNSDTYTESSRTKEGRTEYKRSPFSDYLLGYVEHKTQRGVRLLVPCPSEEHENYHPAPKELYQEESSTQRATYTRDCRDPSYKCDNSNTKVTAPPFSPTKKSSASLSRAHKKPLHMIGPSNTTPSHVELDGVPRTARKPENWSPKSPCSQELPLSSPNAASDMNHIMTGASTSSGIPKTRIKPSPTGAEQEPVTATRSSKASAKPNLCTPAASTIRPLDPKQKTPVTSRVKLNHYPAESSSKKSVPADQGPSTAPRPKKPPPNPIPCWAWKQLNTTQEPSPAQPKRMASATRRSRAEPYAAETPRRRSLSDKMTRETHFSSQENRSGHLPSQQRGSRNSPGEDPIASEIEPALSSVTREVITLSSESIADPRKRAPKRKSSLLTESSEPVLLSPGQSQETDDGAVEPRFRIQKKQRLLK